MGDPAQDWGPGHPTHTQPLPGHSGLLPHLCAHSPGASLGCGCMGALAALTLGMSHVVLRPGRGLPTLLIPSYRAPCPSSGLLCSTESPRTLCTCVREAGAPRRRRRCNG